MVIRSHVPAVHSYGGIFFQKTLFIALSLLLLGLAGCSDDSGSDGQVVLNQRIRSKIQTLDPANVGDTASDGVCREFFECLYAYHYLKRPYELVPQLAESLPHISDDGLVYHFPVRKDVYFHDDPCFPEGRGRQLTANDFIYAWKRIADVKSRSKSWWIFDGKIAGLDEFREYSKTCKKGQVDYTRPVEGLYAEDDFTIVVKLTRPWPQFMFWLAYLATAPMAQEAVDYYGPEIVHHPVGTGAYILKTWNRGVYIDAVRNPKYREEYYPSEGMPGDAEAGLLRDAGKRVPFIDRVIWRVVVEDQPRWLLLMRGEIDLNTIPKDNFGQAVSMGQDLTPEMADRGMKLLLFDEPGTFYLGFNMEDPILRDNKPLRHAIAHAIDRKKYIDLVYSTKGKPAYGYIPPAMAGYDETIKEWSPSVYDPEKAKSLMKEAVAVHGGPIPKLRLASRTGTTPKQSVQFLARSLTEIGLEIEIEFFDWPTFLERMGKKELQLYDTGWLADYPDVENFMQIYYSKNSPWPNSTNYSNPAFDAIYEQIAVMPDCPERTALYRQAQKIVAEDAPCAFTYQRIGYIIHHDWLENIKPDAYRPDTLGSGYIKYYNVDMQKRKEYQRTY